jgi:glycine dehydrogenase
MIALGSCTMKLNAAAEMLPLYALLESIHPFAPLDQVKGYTTMLKKS